MPFWPFTDTRKKVVILLQGSDIKKLENSAYVLEDLVKKYKKELNLSILRGTYEFCLRYVLGQKNKTGVLVLLETDVAQKRAKELELNAAGVTQVWFYGGEVPADIAQAVETAIHIMMESLNA